LISIVSRTGLRLERLIGKISQKFMILLTEKSLNINGRTLKIVLTIKKIKLE
jgi:hypothetical protein